MMIDEKYVLLEGNAMRRDGELMRTKFERHCCSLEMKNERFFSPEASRNVNHGFIVHFKEMNASLN